MKDALQIRISISNKTRKFSKFSYTQSTRETVTTKCIFRFQNGHKFFMRTSLTTDTRNKHTLPALGQAGHDHYTNSANRG